MSHDSNNIMVILSSPSGAGKTTISKKIQQKYQNFKISVSHTTRKPRSNEIEGIDYYFIKENDFKNKIKNNEFYEYAKIFGNYYGTSKKTVNELIKKNDIIFDIDWQGTQQLSDNENAKKDLVSVFVLPPNTKELENRLQTRAQDLESVVRQRMDKATDEMSHYREYKYVIVNDNIEKSVQYVENILVAERVRIERQTGLHEFVQNLRNTN